MADAFRVHSLAAGKRRKSAKSAASGVVVTIRVDPWVWAKAMEIADGDYRRIDIISATTVIVRNRRVR